MNLKLAAFVSDPSGRVGGGNGRRLLTVGQPHSVSFEVRFGFWGQAPDW